MPLTKNELGEDIPKPSREWNELEKRKASLNSKPMNALFCALDKKEFHRVFSCESANEIWHKLEVVYEGTHQVKESKISRFTDIVNTLGALGKTFSNSEKVKKIIRSLPKEWRQKRTAIEEAKDLNILLIDDLIGSFISYEEDLAAERGNEEMKKNIALKATKYESDGESEPDDEELAMLVRSHIRSECPLLNKLKKKAMVATWDDSDEDSSDEKESQEVTNLALMAIEDDDDLNEVSDPTYDELYNAFKEMHDELMKIGKKNACLKKKLLEFTNEKDAMQKCNESLNEKIKGLELENKTLHNRVALSNEKPSTSHEHLESHVDDLKKENEMLKKKNIELSNVVLKFTNGQKILDNMLNSQKCVFDKGGLGSGHADEVSRLDVAILDCILEERVLNIGQIILHHMLSTPSLAKRSLPYASIITQILEYFRVLVTESISLNSRKLGDDSIANLGFYWRDDSWHKDQRNKKVTELAPSDHRFFNDVRPPHLLPDLSAPYLSRPPPSEGPSYSTSADSKDSLQQLLTKVDSLSERQDKLQSMLEAFQLQSISERERLFAQQQQLLDGQQQLFAALGFPPPSSS
ncbi:hypothetical protein KPL70_017253 [Citrus sinensis]|nr:hypothetical protein KPL70_017253 [Citrus sinensis]